VKLENELDGIVNVIVEIKRLFSLMSYLVEKVIVVDV
jgi:hypothetical protein